MNRNTVEFCTSLLSEDGKPPDRLLLLKDGDTELAGTDAVKLDEGSAAKVIKSFEEHGAEVPIDYEHSTIYRAANGQSSPAAGWIRKMIYTPGIGLEAVVEWTKRAADLITSREYKYFSPVTYLEKGTRFAKSVPCVGLTNTPKIKNMKTLMAASLSFLEGYEMTKEKVVMAQHDTGGPAVDGASEMKPGMLMKALIDAGVDVTGEESMEELIAKAVEFINGKSGDAPSDAAASDAATAEAASSALLTAIGAKNSDEAVLMLKQKFVTAEEYQKMSKRVEAQEAEALTRKIDAKMDGYIAENKINPNDKEHVAAARKFAEKNFNDWVEFTDAMPALIPAGRVTSPAGTEVRKTGDRDSVIASAAREFRDAQLVGSKSPFINQRLREAEFTLLTADEKGKL